MAQVERVPAALLVARYLTLRERHQRAHFHGHPDTAEVKAALVDAMANIWANIGQSDRMELAMAIARKGEDPINADEVDAMAELLEGDAFRLRREAERVAKMFLGEGAR